jgi:hypothetical protein
MNSGIDFYICPTSHQKLPKRLPLSLIAYCLRSTLHLGYQFLRHLLDARMVMIYLITCYGNVARLARLVDHTRTRSLLQVAMTNRQKARFAEFAENLDLPMSTILRAAINLMLSRNTVDVFAVPRVTADLTANIDDETPSTLPVILTPARKAAFKALCRSYGYNPSWVLNRTIDTMLKHGSINIFSPTLINYPKNHDN